MGIIKAHGECNFLYGQIRKIELLGCLLHLHLNEIIDGGVAGFLFK